MKKPEYVRVKLEDVSQEFIEEYHLLEKKATDGSILKFSVADMDYLSQANWLKTCSE